MSAWHKERASLFDELIAEYGTKLTINGVSIPCISPPNEQIKNMTEGPFVMSRPAQFEVRRSDYVASRIVNKSLLKFSGKEFEVYSIVDDPVDEGVKLNCILKQ